MTRGGLICGAITAIALSLVFAALDEYQVPNFADRDSTIGLVGGVVAAIGAAALIGLLRSAYGGKWPRGHVIVPLLLVPPPLFWLTLGGERDRLEAALIWAFAAMAAHQLVGRRWAVPAVAGALAVAALLTWANQPRWREHKFEAMTFPRYVPEVPGYRLTGAYAGRANLIERLDGPGGGIDVYINRGVRPCPGAPQELNGNGVMLCLPGGYTMTLTPTYGSASITHLLPRISARQVTAADLASHPDGNTAGEAD